MDHKYYSSRPLVEGGMVGEGRGVGWAKTGRVHARGVEWSGGE